MRVLITGGTGLIGKKLTESLLKDDHEVLNLSRSARGSSPKGLRNIQWDGHSIPAEVGEVDVVVNLAGASIAGQRWTEAYKKLLLDSRVNATKACAEFIRNSTVKPQVFLSASGFNYYGSLIQEPVTESSPPGDGFMADICKAWEGAAKDTGVRTALMRIAVVLDAHEGPLAKMLPAYRFFVGGPTGTGDQGFPWIHIDDIVAAMRFIIDTPEIEGPVNMASPAPITAQQFSNAVGKVLGRPNFMRLGRSVLEIIFGEMSVVLWGGAVVLPNVLSKHGFQWKYRDIEPALRDLLK